MSPGGTAVPLVVLSRVPGTRGIAPLPERGFGAMCVLSVPCAGGGPKPPFWVLGAREERGGGQGAVEAAALVLVLRAGSHGHRGREPRWRWRCGGSRGACRQVLALLWMVLLVRQPWCHWRPVGLAQHGTLRGAGAAPVWPGTGATVQGAGQILPPRRLFSNCERCRGCGAAGRSVRGAGYLAASRAAAPGC